MNDDSFLHAFDLVQRQILLSTNPSQIRLAKASRKNVDVVFRIFPRAEANAGFAFYRIHCQPYDAQVFSGFKSDNYRDVAQFKIIQRNHLQNCELCEIR